MRKRAWLLLAMVVLLIGLAQGAIASNFYWKSSLTDLQAISGSASGDRGIVITDEGAVSFYYHNGTSWTEATLGSVDSLPDPNANVLLYWNNTSKGLDFLTPTSAFTTSGGQIDLATSAVTTDKIADSAVDSFKLATSAVTTDKIADSAVTAGKIADSAVSPAKLDAAADDVGLTYVIDGYGSAITTGLKGFIVAPFSGTISRVDLVADVSGSIVVDLWKMYASIPTVSDTITASDKPTLSSSQYVSNTSISGWTTAVSTGDVIGFNVDSASTVTKVSICIFLDR